MSMYESPKAFKCQNSVAVKQHVLHVFIADHFYPIFLHFRLEYMLQGIYVGIYVTYMLQGYSDKYGLSVR